MYQFLKGVSKMIPHAKGWALKINSMILNSEPYKESYIKAIKRLENEKRKLRYNIQNNQNTKTASMISTTGTETDSASFKNLKIL